MIPRTDLSPEAQIPNRSSKVTRRLDIIRIEPMAAQL
jgi:hypothetical protein